MKSLLTVVDLLCKFIPRSLYLWFFSLVNRFSVLLYILYFSSSLLPVLYLLIVLYLLFIGYLMLLVWMFSEASRFLLFIMNCMFMCLLYILLLLSCPFLHLFVCLFRTKSNQRWMKLRTTVQISSAIQKVSIPFPQS